MVMRAISLYILLGHLIGDAASDCVSRHCLRCDSTEEPANSCQACLDTKCINETYANNSSNCKEAFQVSINSTGSKVSEGDDITLTCVHNVPNLNLTIGWQKDRMEMEENKNMSKLFLQNVLASEEGHYICYVNSSCGNYRSSPEEVTVKNNNVIILVICGIAALVLVLIMGLIMKCKLKRDNAKNKARMAQRIQAERAGGPLPFTPRES